MSNHNSFQAEHSRVYFRHCSQCDWGFSKYKWFNFLSCPRCGKHLPVNRADSAGLRPQAPQASKRTTPKPAPSNSGREKIHRIHSSEPKIGQVTRLQPSESRLQTSAIQAMDHPILTGTGAALIGAGMVIAAPFMAAAGLSIIAAGVSMVSVSAIAGCIMGVAGVVSGSPAGIIYGAGIAAAGGLLGATVAAAGGLVAATGSVMLIGGTVFAYGGGAVALGASGKKLHAWEMENGHLRRTIGNWRAHLTKRQPEDKRIP